jgi:hypothetical protein
VIWGIAGAAMSDELVTYLRDHLSGAIFAVELLEDLEKQTQDPQVARLAAALVEDVKADKQQLENLTERFASSSPGLKQVASWISQKASLFKLNIETPLGIFEALELLCLGVRGKLALWTALESSGLELRGYDLQNLQQRALDQHACLEGLRLELAARALGRAT